MTAHKDNVVAVIARLPRRAQVLLASDMVNAFGAGLVLPFLLIYLSQVRHLDIRVAAVALSVTAIFAFITGPVWGILLDRYSHRTVMPAVMLVAAVGSSLYAVADSSWSALAISALCGVGMGGVGPAIRTMLATVVPQRERTQFFGLQFGIFNASIGLGILVGGLLVNGSLGRYQLLYAGDGITFVFMAIALLIFLPGGAAEASADEGDEGDEGDERAAGRSKPSYRSMLSNPAVILIMVAMALGATFYYGAFESALPGYLTMGHAVSPRGISGVFVINVVVVVLAQFLVMPRLGRVRRTTWLTGSGLLWGVSWLLVLWAGRSAGPTALVLLFTASVPFAVAEVMVTPILAALLNDVVPDKVRGRANAMFTLSITGGAILGPAVTATLLPFGKGVPLVVGLAAGCLLTLIPATMLRGRLRSDVDKPPEVAEPEVAGAASAGSGDRSESVPA